MSSKVKESSSSEWASSSVIVLSTEIKDRLTWEKITDVVPTIPSIDTWENPMDSSRIVLGCFDVNAQWTDKRTDCAITQQLYVEQLTIGGRTDDNVAVSSSAMSVVVTTPPKATPAGTTVTREMQEVKSDAPIRTVIDQDFVSEKKRLEKTDVLKSTISETLASLAGIEKLNLLPETAKQDVRLRSQRLQEFLTNADTLTTFDIDTRIQSARIEIAGIAATVKESMKKADDNVRIPTDSEVIAIVTKLDRIVAVAPQAHTLLSTEGITVKAAAVEALAGARLALQKTHDSCSTLSRCASLTDTISALEQWRDSMQASAAGRQDLLKKIEDLIGGK